MVIDVSTIILGGGPAACASAIHLARAGRKVVILERTRYEARRVGESLAPSAKPYLDRLGAWEKWNKGEHLPCPGIVSVWGSPQPFENDFIFNPYGNGWHVDRRRFDKSMAGLARDVGVSVHSGTRVTSLLQSDDGWWDVEARNATTTLRLRGEFLIDATGRACWLSRRLGARTLFSDQLVGLVANFSLPKGLENDQRTWLEATENGWWYSVVLPGGRIAIAYMTDADLLPRKPRNIQEFANHQLARTAQMRLRLPNGSQATGFRVVSAASYRMDRIAGRNWATVGDAAMGWDPLSGQGITKALESAFHVADALMKVGDGHPTALDEYANWVELQFDDYLHAYTHYYRAETRWPESLFWQRRQQA